MEAITYRTELGMFAGISQDSREIRQTTSLLMDLQYEIESDDALSSREQEAGMAQIDRIIGYLQGVN